MGEVEILDTKGLKITPENSKRCVKCGIACTVYWYTEGNLPFCKVCADWTTMKMQVRKVHTADKFWDVKYPEGLEEDEMQVVNPTGRWSED